jgi:uncharacterized protein GlcG (DUF336 family)
MAEKAVKAAHAKAKELGTPMTVGVVDEGGRLLLLSRGDGAGPLSPDIAIAKAVAAVGFRLSTKEMGELYKGDPAFWGSVSAVLAGQALPSAGPILLYAMVALSEQLDAVVGQVNKITSALKQEPLLFSASFHCEGPSQIKETALALTS